MPGIKPRFLLCKGFAPYLYAISPTPASGIFSKGLVLTPLWRGKAAGRFLEDALLGRLYPSIHLVQQQTHGVQEHRLRTWAGQDPRRDWAIIRNSFGILRLNSNAACHAIKGYWLLMCARVWLLYFSGFSFSFSLLLLCIRGQYPAMLKEYFWVTLCLGVTPGGVLRTTWYWEPESATYKAKALPLYCLSNPQGWLVCFFLYYTLNVCVTECVTPCLEDPVINTATITLPKLCFDSNVF